MTNDRRGPLGEVSSQLFSLLGLGEEVGEIGGSLGHPLPGHHVPAQSPRGAHLSRLLLLDSTVISVVRIPASLGHGCPETDMGPLSLQAIAESRHITGTQARGLAELLDPSMGEGALPGQGRGVQEGGAVLSGSVPGGKQPGCCLRCPVRRLTWVGSGCRVALPWDEYT